MGVTASTRFIRPGAFLLGLLLAIPLVAEPRLVQDLHQGLVDDFEAMRAARVQDGILYFSFADPAHGRELWRTDGTEEGTWRLTDICPGPCDTDPESVEILGGSLYFQASDGVSGRELWRSDGTPGSERQVRDLCPGPCSSRVVPQTFGDRLLFLAVAGEGLSLWRSDGTPAGTVRIREICADCSVGSELQRAGDLLVFGVSNEKGHELWGTDGTPEGTRRLRKFAPGAEWWNYPSPLSAGDFAFFWTHGALWRTDGTPGGTVQIQTMSGLTCRDCTWVPESVVWKGALYSILEDGQLIRSNGTRAGTEVLAEFFASDSIRSLTPLADRLVFLAGSDGYLYEIWQTQGTAETTRRISDPPAFESMEALIPWGETRAVVQYRRGDDSWGLWMTDGTDEGSQTLEGFPYGGLVPAGDRLYVLSWEQHALLRLDAPGAAPVQVLDLRTEASSGPLAQTVLEGKLLFSARTSDVRAPLFVTDGTPTGLVQLSAQADWADQFTRVGDRFFFTARMPREYDNSRTIERDTLWSTDGTPGGTTRTAARIYWFSAVGGLGNRLLFAADRDRQGGGSPFWSDIELWRSDRAPRSTSVVKNINPFMTDNGYDSPVCLGDPSSPGPGVVVGGRMLFAADDGRTGRELWSSDGTPGGSRLLLDINPRTIPAPPGNTGDCWGPKRDHLGRGSDPASLVAFRGGALFSAYEGTAGRELWWSDGTRTGTRRVKDLRPGIAGSFPRALTPLGGAVYFIATTGTGGDGLWRTDGTSRGTFLVHDLTLGGRPSWAGSLTAVGNRLFFAVYNETTGAELWTTRGTRASTALVVDLHPGPLGSYPQNLTDIGGVLVFAADNGSTGLEPWRSDGTAAGTHLLGDLWPGREPSAPGPFSKVGDLVLTGANDGEHGRELWAIPLEDLGIEP